VVHKGGKDDDNMKRVMVAGSANRVTALREERKKGFQKTEADDIQDVRSKDGTGSELAFLLLSFSFYFLLC
jgi:hypothetical protein